MSSKTKHKNFRNFVHAALILLLMILLTNVILQGSLAAEIKGKVVGINGENLNGAEVKIYNGTNLMQNVVTVNGVYTINLSEGNYFVVVTYIDNKENLYIDSINLAIEQNETKSMDFSLIAAYTNFSDTYIPALEDIFKIETNLTGDSQPNGSNDTNLPNSGNISLNMLLFIIIFIPVIILVFFYIFYVYYKAKKAEEKIDEVETIIKKNETGKKAEEKQPVIITSPITLIATSSDASAIPQSAATDTTVPPLAVAESKAEKKEEDADKKEQYKDMIQKERENLLLSLTENERSVINLLMEHNGDLLRTEISRGTNLPKSSLAMALKKLEDKKIIEIDKTFTIHKVKFTAWFKSLL